MMRLFIYFVFTFFTVDAHAASYQSQLPNHQLHVTLYPEQHALKAEDVITLPRGAPRTLIFSLHSELDPTSTDAEIKFIGKAHESWMKQYSVTPRPGRDNFTIEYGGEIFHPLQQEIREARSFENTQGIISAEGVVLNGDSGWYPRLELAQYKGMLTYKLEVEQPRNWHTISQGSRSMAKDQDVVWEERQPQSEIHLIAGRFKEYDLNKEGIQAMVFLRNNNNDADLAQHYLEAAVRYITLYQNLIGPYPYAKFALVENFWETGFGMPSFTLLGSQVIRLPFIINSSYPHEILHNWLGNSVYVDYEKGNWSEGLTAYLADHLIQEQKGNGAGYRRTMLQKYADFVSVNRDFPLSRFTSRNSVSSEAVGYGKAMMMFHMLRKEMEDDRFIVGLQSFYKTYQFQQASFSDLEQLFSQAARKNLKPFFTQWTQLTGAPELRLVSAIVGDDGKGYELIVGVEQIQPGPAYQLEVPLAVTLEGESDAYSTVMSMTTKQAKFRIRLKERPLRVDVDPEYDLFRRLDEEEMPAAFSQVMGAEKLWVILPGKASAEMRKQYADMAQSWQQQPSRTTLIKWDDELEFLPAEGAVWLLGWENKFRGEFQSALDPSAASLNNIGAVIGGKKLSRETDALALTARIGETPAAWLAVPDAKMLPALSRKLPHYAQYSYAAFNGDKAVENSPIRTNQPKRPWLAFPRPGERNVESNDSFSGDRGLADINNILKGVWPVTKSPLAMAVRQVDGSVKNVAIGALARRNPLAK